MARPSDELLRRMDAYWRAANYLCVGQIYLYANPLLREPLAPSHLKPRLLGHWGTTPGQNFVYVHLNRVILEHDVDMFYVAGPGHGGPAVVANTYLEGTYSEIYPHVTRDEAGLATLFRQFSQIGAFAAVLGGLDTLVFTGGIGEHAAAVREEAGRGLDVLGIRLDPERNARHDAVVSGAGGRCTVRVVPTDEALVIARHTRALLA